jgi:hypothetical protein
LCIWIERLADLYERKDGVRNMRHKRVVAASLRWPGVITVIEEELPTPKAGEVRLKVLAAGGSLPDVLAREASIPKRRVSSTRRVGISSELSINSARA